MCQRLRIRMGNAEVSVRLNESATAQALRSACPFEATAQTWGSEVYFAVPVRPLAAEATAELVPAGAVAIWPGGPALCLFWGRTPLSVGDEIRPASAVAVVGLIDDLAAVVADLDAVEAGQAVEVTRALTGK